MPTIVKRRTPEAVGVTLVVICGLTIWLCARFLDQTEWVRHTLLVQTKIAQIVSLVQDAEIGQRTYILTGDEPFLTPLTRAKARLQDELDELARLISDNPGQTAALGALRPLIAERIAFADETVAQRGQEISKAPAQKCAKAQAPA